MNDRSHLTSRLRRAQDRLAASFGILPSDRSTTVADMLSRSARLAASYWLQITLSTGIATLGLVLGSTAVVIGAMLISPLMSPLVQLGMGLAIGSPFLVIRSSLRTFFSIAWVIAGAAMLTVLLPFHEVTGEIAARTSPTALDLGVAVCCAIAAAYAVIRPGSDTTATAAGTAVGIALVPPLCVVGYGIGTRSLRIAAGATLLFTANFCAIVLFAVLSFLLLGYSSIPIRALEKDEFAKSSAGGLTIRVARTLERFFSSKYGPTSRVLMPVAFALAVFVPLQRALAEVSWQVRVRSAIDHMLGKLPQESVSSSVKVEGHSVAVRLVTVGRGADAASLQSDLTQRIQALAGVKPTIEVIAVPDMDTLRRVETKLSDLPRSAPDPGHADLSLLHRQANEVFGRVWPKDAAGPLIGWHLGFVGNHPTVYVVHLGDPLGTAGESLLAHAFSTGLGVDIAIDDVALPTTSYVAEPEAGLSWLPGAAQSATAARENDGVFACIQVPDPKKESNRKVRDLVSVVRTSPAFAGRNIGISVGSRWEIQLSTVPCTTEIDAGVSAAAAADGGSSDDAATHD